MVPEVYLVVEISRGIGPGDVERAVRRAVLLAQIGVQTLPVVAGDHIFAVRSRKQLPAGHVPQHAVDALPGAAASPARTMVTTAGT